MFPIRQVVTITPSPLLLWVHTGTVQLRIAKSYHLSAGQCILIPFGTELSVDMSPDALIIPIQLPQHSRPSIGVFRVPDHAYTQLMYAFAQTLGYLKENPDCAQFLHDLVSAVPQEPRIAPPLPQSSEALTVARRIIADPITITSVTELAKSVGLSERTLQRRFLDETGISISLWRTRTRLSLAVAFLADGHSAQWAAHHVGFSGASSLAKAFRTHIGVTPGQIDQLNMSPTAAPPILNFEFPKIPASETWPRINGSHIMVWSYRGTSTAEVADREISLPQGSVLILPAGMRLDISMPSGALVLPLGYQSPESGALSADEVQIIRPNCSENTLLQCTLAAYTPFRPAHHKPDYCFSLLFDSATNPHYEAPEALQMAVHTARQRKPEITAPAGLALAGFEDSTGTGFQRWGLIRRMTLARIQLSRGIAPSVVARNLGYTHLPAFTRAFSEAHGCSPTQYQNDCVPLPGL